MTTDLCNLTACDLRTKIAAHETSCLEVMDAHIARIESANPAINALCTFLPEEGRALAKAADGRLAKGSEPRPLEGLPVAVKDLAETKRIRTTYGSPLFENNVPAFDQLFVQRLKEAGALVIGKTNTPEFGAGSQTFNRLFGASRNPYNTDKTVGGSSGGAAAALAARMLPIADGSDLGGSLRNPAAFCNVVGFRPTPGRVPSYPSLNAWNPLPVTGPMARTVNDTALLLSVMAGPDPRDPLSLQMPGDILPELSSEDTTKSKIAYTPDLGFLPVDPAVAKVIAAAPDIFREIGCTVEEAAPDLKDGPETFQTLRAHMFATSFGDAYETAPDKLKDTIIWNIERGLALKPTAIGKAQVSQTQMFHRMRKFFENYDFLILPVTQVPPFDVEIEWVREINGVQMETYLDWMEICSVITLSCCPAISVPCGFTEDGLPIGLQIVGPYGSDRRVLDIAHAFEKATGFWQELPGGI